MQNKYNYPTKDETTPLRAYIYKNKNKTIKKNKKQIGYNNV